MRSDDSEDKAVQEISERLKSRYGKTESVTVDRAVKAARDTMRNSRIRDFVPIFIERRARTALDASGEHGQSPGLQ